MKILGYFFRFFWGEFCQTSHPVMDEMWFSRLWETPGEIFLRFLISVGNSKFCEDFKAIALKPTKI